MALVTNRTSNYSYGRNDIRYTKNINKNVSLTGSAGSIKSSEIEFLTPIDNIEVVAGSQSTLKSLKFFFADSNYGITIMDMIDVSGGEINMGPRIPSKITLDYSAMGVETPIVLDFLNALNTPEGEDNGLPSLFYGTSLGNIFDDMAYDQVGEEIWEMDEGALMLGHSGDDILDGTSNVDYLYGGSRSDLIEGNAGADYLFGDGGNDLLANDGSGADALLAGGAGNDYYALSLGGIDIFNIEKVPGTETFWGSLYNSSSDNQGYLFNEWDDIWSFIGVDSTFSYNGESYTVKEIVYNLDITGPNGSNTNGYAVALLDRQITDLAVDTPTEYSDIPFETDWLEEQITGYENDLTTIYDSSGSEDVIFIESVYAGSFDLPTFDSNINPLDSDIAYRVEVINGDLEFGVSFTENAYLDTHTVLDPSYRWNWFRPNGITEFTPDIPGIELDTPDWEFGTLDTEAAVFDFNDPYTWPLFNELNSSAQKFAADLLNPNNYDNHDDYYNVVSEFANQSYSYYSNVDFYNVSNASEFMVGETVEVTDSYGNAQGTATVVSVEPRGNSNVIELSGYWNDGNTITGLDSKVTSEITHNWNLWDGSNSEGQYRVINPDMIDSYNSLQQATTFDVEDSSTWPVIPFVESILYNIYDVNDFGDITESERGFKIVDFETSNPIEFIGTQTDEYLNSYLNQPPSNEDAISMTLLESIKFDVSGGYVTVDNLDKALQNVKDTFLANEWMDLFKISNTGVAIDSSDAFLLATSANYSLLSGTAKSDLDYHLAGSAEIAGSAIAAGKGGDDVLFSLYTDDIATMSTLAGAEGNDWFELQGGNVLSLGGIGDDVFVIRDNGNELDAELYGGEDFDTLYIDYLYEDIWNDAVFNVDGSGEISLDQVRADGTEYRQAISFYDFEKVVFQDYSFDPSDRLIIGQETTLSGSSDTFYGEDDLHDHVFSFGGEKIISGAGDDEITLYSNSISNSATVDTGVGDDTVTVYSGFSGLLDLSGAETLNIEGFITSQYLRGDTLVLEVEGVTTISLIGGEPDTVNLIDADGNVIDSIDFTKIEYLTDGDSPDADDFYTLEPGITTVYAYGGNDFITGNELDNLIFGGEGNDGLSGGEGSDILYGDAGDDTLSGDSGEDVLDGGSGDDAIDGGLGSDALYGGGGSDTYFQVDGNSGYGGYGLDRIYDLEGIDDNITLSNWNYDITDSQAVKEKNNGKEVSFMKDGDLYLAKVYTLDGDTNFTKGFFNSGWQTREEGNYILEGVVIDDFIYNTDTIETITFGSGSGTEKLYKLDNDANAGGETDDYWLITNGYHNNINGIRQAQGGDGDDFIKGSSSGDDEVLIGNGGDDVIHNSGGNNLLIGGDGDDIFRIGKKSAIDDFEKPYSWVIGDNSSYTFDDGRDFTAYELTDFTDSSSNTSYADSIEFSWTFEESRIYELGETDHIRVERVNSNGDVMQTVDVIDVETIKFWDNESQDFVQRSLLEGVSKDHSDIDYVENNVQFVFGSNDNKDHINIYYTQTGADPELPPELLATYQRNELSEIVFKDQTVNVKNIAAKDYIYDSGTEDASADYTGTEGVDIIFGDDRNNTIYGGGGDDFIFAGDGDDVIIGGDGDDIISGGDGADTISGDEDAFADNFDEANLSDGNDVIIGGSGVDEIHTGGGKNIAVSGTFDKDSDDAMSESINNDISDLTDQDQIIDNDEWI